MGERQRERMAGLGALSTQQWVASCWCDMRSRWLRQDYVRVEQYLPDGSADEVPQDALLDMIYAEYILSKELGRPVDHQSYYRRFPELERALRRQFAVDDALSIEIPVEFESTLTGSTDGSTVQEPEVPERIGKYVVVARIGVGGQAEIFRAVHPGLGKEVVLKRARHSAHMAAADRQRLEAEARILARIEHPNLGSIYDLDFHDDRPFLVMEFIRGRTLEQFADQQRPTPHQAAELVAKIARGVAAAQRHGIAHLDIKPSNVLIDDRGEPRLIDFGLWHLADAWHEEVLEQDSLRGTLHFMAPEQARGDTEKIGHRSDIFALGGLLFFLLTRRSPYPLGLTFPELLSRCRQCQWDQDLLYRRHIPPRLRQCCVKAMSEQAEQRYETAEAMARDLQQANRLRWRHLWTMVLVGSLLLAGGVVLAVGNGWFRQSSETPKPAAAAILDAELAVQVWDVNRFRDLTQMVPVRSGDAVGITATIPSGMHYSVFCFNSEGVLEQVQQGVSDGPTGWRWPLRIPGAGKAVRLVGPPGTELILVCGRTSDPLNGQELARLTELGEPLPALPAMSVLRLVSEGVQVEQRGRGLGGQVAVPDAEAIVQERLESLGQVLRHHADFFEALAFSHQ